MKYLLVLAVAFVVIWIWKSNRRVDISEKANAKPPKKQNQKMVPMEIVACDVCGVHLPRAEALPGPRGVYCSAAHRQQAET